MQKKCKEKIYVKNIRKGCLQQTTNGVEEQRKKKTVHGFIGESEEKKIDI